MKKQLKTEISTRETVVTKLTQQIDDQKKIVTAKYPPDVCPVVPKPGCKLRDFHQLVYPKTRSTYTYAWLFKQLHYKYKGEPVTSSKLNSNFPTGVRKDFSVHALWESIFQLRKAYLEAQQPSPIIFWNTLTNSEDDPLSSELAVKAVKLTKEGQELADAVLKLPKLSKYEEEEVMAKEQEELQKLQMEAENYGLELLATPKVMNKQDGQDSQGIQDGINYSQGNSEHSLEASLKEVEK